jgi:hypothetical protein
MSIVGRNGVWTAAVLSIFALSAAGCLATVADSPLADGASDIAARTKETSAYIPVHDVPLDRIEPTMDPGQRAKIQAELIAARDRQASASTAEVAAGAAKNPAAK